MRIESIPTVSAVKPAVKVQPEQAGIGLKNLDIDESSRSLNKNGGSAWDASDIMQAVKQANKALEGTNRRFEYSIHEQTNTIVVKVIDTETNEVIREIPPEKILNLIAKLWELAGIIVDEKV
ncbi:MAG: flagellar protein FlaG [Clostridiales bacterium]|nr:flagellar protein FlaG [Clostridiales bacterium]